MTSTASAPDAARPPCLQPADLAARAITAHVSARQAGLTWAVTTTALAGALLMGGSGIWQGRLMFRLGLWVTLVNAVSAIAGPGWQALILSVAGGGVQVAVAVYGWLRSSRRVPAAVPASS